MMGREYVDKVESDSAESESLEIKSVESESVGISLTTCLLIVWMWKRLI